MVIISDECVSNFTLICRGTMGTFPPTGTQVVTWLPRLQNRQSDELDTGPVRQIGVTRTQRRTNRILPKDLKKRQITYDYRFGTKGLVRYPLVIETPNSTQ